MVLPAFDFEFQPFEGWIRVTDLQLNQSVVFDGSIQCTATTIDWEDQRCPQTSNKMYEVTYFRMAIGDNLLFDGSDQPLPEDSNLLYCYEKLKFKAQMTEYTRLLDIEKKFFRMNIDQPQTGSNQAIFDQYQKYIMA